MPIRSFSSVRPLLPSFLPFPPRSLHAPLLISVRSIHPSTYWIRLTSTLALWPLVLCSVFRLFAYRHVMSTVFASISLSLSLSLSRVSDSRLPLIRSSLNFPRFRFRFISSLSFHSLSSQSTFESFIHSMYSLKYPFPLVIRSLFHRCVLDS
ncbi:hypothetical protein CPB83DRAFT_289734 [Crepidotus variabilis]|uniref:Uncharacterized protein n=1 Tax=Crepidotus variabilis TaxID=179855 RepID=A0A9P6EH80_9AGAR|nr:hypothetical protein CPB83DRAFT_289734 [Crepidotus variabilis]